MIVEDDFLSEIHEYEHRIAESNQQKEEERRQKEEERRQKEEAIRKQQEAIKLLLKSGMTKEEISAVLQIPIADIEKIH